MYKLVKRFIQYFCFPNSSIKDGTSWISRKGEILEKGEGGSRKGGGEGGMTSLHNYAICISKI